MTFPDDTQRLSIIGATGSGKTQCAQWHLSHRNFHHIPWLIYDFKRDESIESIPRVREIGIGEIPNSPGVYVVHPHPEDKEGVEDQLWAIWEHGDCGVYIDEGYMMGDRNPAFRSLLTQGRSKGIPMIILSQRPVWMDRFVFSESEYFQIFRLQHDRDKANVEQFVPVDLSIRIPEYCSWYYTVKIPPEKNVNPVILRPVPKIEAIHATFERRLRPIRAVI